ncbi:MAG TPA: hypothetical protein VOA88_21035 [Candidatus Dormibacteraeota bacterium]|nr:hypothetical protein [Candidatus Dormibacteraeota bacterium]
MSNTLAAHEKLPYNPAQKCEICGEPATFNRPLVEDWSDGGGGWGYEVSIHEDCRRADYEIHDNKQEYAPALNDDVRPIDVEALARRLGVRARVMRGILEYRGILPRLSETCAHCNKLGTAQNRLSRRMMGVDDGVVYRHQPLYVGCRPVAIHHPCELAAYQSTEFLLPDQITDLLNEAHRNGWLAYQIPELLKENFNVARPKDLRQSQLAGVMDIVQEAPKCQYCGELGTTDRPVLRRTLTEDGACYRDDQEVPGNVWQMAVTVHDACAGTDSGLWERLHEGKLR